MSDSYISHGPSGTSFVGPDATKLFQAKAVRGALSIHLKCGILPCRITITRVLATATTFTHSPYGRGRKEEARAIADLDTWIAAMTAALPIRQQ